MKLFVDDERFPPAPEDDWVLARSSSEAIGLMRTHGCPNFISFDHDLGGSDSGMIIVKWIIDQDIDTDGRFIPEDISWSVHSENPVGRENIHKLLSRYLDEKHDNAAD